MTQNLPTAEFLNYIRAFNARDYAAQHAFYTDDVELVLPDTTVGTLKGKGGIMAHYGAIHANADETVVPLIVMSDRGRVFLQMEAYFYYKNEVEQAVHNYHVHPGDVIRIRCCAIYDLAEGGKMRRITCYLFGEELLGKVDVRDKIKESENRADADLRLSR
ncbi:hypothetical protein GQ53DRAFT_890378 [Thozetella sp. PMI_491]|nr:hypothetical protein GQ53DRAFT_890378 [Thozetella sp. PMI_491]